MDGNGFISYSEFVQTFKVQASSLNLRCSFDRREFRLTSILFPWDVIFGSDADLLDIAKEIDSDGTTALAPTRSSF